MSEGLSLIDTDFLYESRTAHLLEDVTASILDYQTE